MREEQDSKLFIGNLPWSTTDHELREAFEDFGAIRTASVVNDRDTGKSRGFAFIQFESAEDAKSAVDAMNGVKFGGRDLVVNIARPKGR